MHRDHEKGRWGRIFCFFFHIIFRGTTISPNNALVIVLLVQDYVIDLLWISSTIGCGSFLSLFPSLLLASRSRRRRRSGAPFTIHFSWWKRYHRHIMHVYMPSSYCTSTVVPVSCLIPSFTGLLSTLLFPVPKQKLSWVSNRSFSSSRTNFTTIYFYIYSLCIIWRFSLPRTLRNSTTRLP